MDFNSILENSVAIMNNSSGVYIIGLFSLLGGRDSKQTVE